MAELCDELTILRIRAEAAEAAVARLKAPRWDANYESRPKHRTEVFLRCGLRQETLAVVEFSIVDRTYKWTCGGSSGQAWTLAEAKRDAETFWRQKEQQKDTQNDH